MRLLWQDNFEEMTLADDSDDVTLMRWIWWDDFDDVTLSFSDLLTGYVYHILQVSFTTKEARKLASGPTGESSQYACFPWTLPDWDVSTVEGKERLLLCHQALQAALRAATNGPQIWPECMILDRNKTFLERVMGTFWQYTPMDPKPPEAKAAITLALLRRKHQILDLNYSLRLCWVFSNYCVFEGQCFFE